MNQLKYFFGLHIPRRVPSNAVATCGNNTGDKCIRKRYFKSRILKNVKSDNFLRQNLEDNQISKITINRYHDNPKSNSRSTIKVKSKTDQFEVARKAKSTKIHKIARHNKRSSQSKIPQSNAYSLSQISTFKSDSKNETTYSKKHVEKLKTQNSKNDTLLLTTHKNPRSYAKLIANYAEELRTNPKDESRSTSTLGLGRCHESERFSRARRSMDVLGPRRQGSSTSSMRVSIGPRDSEKYSEWLGVMEATLRGLKSHANLNEGAKIMKDTKFDEAEVLEFVDRNADWLDEVVAAHVAQKKPKPVISKNELVSVAKSARGFATKSEITSDKKSTVGDRTIHPDSIPAKREYLLECLAGEKSETNFKIKMKSPIETNLGSEVTLRLGQSVSGLSVNIKGSSVNLNLESSTDAENMKNVPEVQSYYDLSKSKLKNEFRDENLDKRDIGSSVHINVNEERQAAEDTPGSVRQIEIRIDGKAGTEAETVSTRINDVDIVSSVGNVQIVLPSFARVTKGFLKEGKSQGSFLNLQISSGQERSLETAVKGVSSSGSPGAGAASTGSIGSRGNTPGSSSGGSKPGSKGPEIQSSPQQDSKNNSTVIRITSRVLPWWASPDSFRFIRDSGGTSGSGSTEAGKAPSRSKSTNQVERSRKFSKDLSPSVADDKKSLGKSKISQSQSHGNVGKKINMAVANEKPDTEQKLIVGSISQKRLQTQSGLSTGRERSKKRRRSASAITKIIKNEMKKKNDRISAKVENDVSRKGYGLNISKKQENFGNKIGSQKNSHIAGADLKKIYNKMDTTGNVGGKKFTDASRVTSKIQNQKKTTVAFDKAETDVSEELEASKAKSMKIEGSKMTDKVKIETDGKLDILPSSNLKKIELKNDKEVSKISRISPSKVISKKDTETDVKTVKSSKDTNYMKMKSLKPISKKDDGTLIDYGVKVMSRKKSKRGLNESKTSDGIDMIELNKSIKENRLNIKENPSGNVAIQKTEISKKEGKNHVVERKASLTKIPRLKIVLEPMKKVKSIAKETETTRTQVFQKNVIFPKNSEATKMTSSKNSHDRSIPRNDVRPEKELLYAIWLERFDRKMTKDKITKSKPPKI